MTERTKNRIAATIVGVLMLAGLAVGLYACADLLEEPAGATECPFECADVGPDPGTAEDQASRYVTQSSTVPPEVPAIIQFAG